MDVSIPAASHQLSQATESIMRRLPVHGGVTIRLLPQREDLVAERKGIAKVSQCSRARRALCTLPGAFIVLFAVKKTTGIVGCRARPCRRAQGLVPVELRHYPVHENGLRLFIGDLAERSGSIRGRATSNPARLRAARAISRTSGSSSMRRIATHS